MTEEEKTKAINEVYRGLASGEIEVPSPPWSEDEIF